MSVSPINFGAGPSKLPDQVIAEAQAQLASFEQLGLSVLEMSHRSSAFAGIIKEAEQLLREAMDIPADYRVLFVQGGATGQFSAVPLNLIGRRAEGTADYLVTGSWSAKAADEATKYGAVREVLPRQTHFVDVPEPGSWSVSPTASYVYYCANETVDGLEFPDAVDTALEGAPDVPVVCDMSSSLLSRSVQVAKFGVIFASAQKNLGPAGLTVVLVRPDLLGHALPHTPSVLSWRRMAEAGSLYNTPPTFSIYVAALVLRWLHASGGVPALARANQDKAARLYAFLDGSGGFYRCPVRARCRSLVNAVFRVRDGDERLEAALVAFARTRHGIIEIKGHRSVGGLRASMYNALPLAAVLALIACLDQFRALTLQQEQHQQQQACGAAAGTTVDLL